MIIIDKAAWHIDGMVEPKAVIEYFKRVIKWLSDKDMLSQEGRETYNSGIDDSISLNESLLTKEALAFLTSKYDTYLEKHFEDDEDCMYLDNLYHDYLKASPSCASL